MARRSNWYFVFCFCVFFLCVCVFVRYVLLSVNQLIAPQHVPIPRPASDCTPKACGVASSSGSNVAHSPVTQRNVGTPDSADTGAGEHDDALRGSQRGRQRGLDRERHRKHRPRRRAANVSPLCSVLHSRRVPRGPFASHGRQHARPPLQRHVVRRIPRSRDRLRGRRLPAGHGAVRSRHPARARSPQARHFAPRHAAARGERVEILSGVFEGRRRARRSRS